MVKWRRCKSASPLDCRKRTHRKVNIKNESSLVRNITSLLMSFFHFCSFCHKCQKPLFYTLCLLRHRSLPYLCTACFALPRLRPFSFVLSACRLYRHAAAMRKCIAVFVCLYFGLSLSLTSEALTYVCHSERSRRRSRRISITSKLLKCKEDSSRS